MKTLNVEDTLRPKSVGRLNNLPLDEKLVFSSGIGINPAPKEIPIRYLSYLLPLISCTQKYRNAIGQIYTADQAAIRLGIENSSVSENVRLIRNFTIGFVAEMFPDLVDKITISEEKSEFDNDIKELIEDTIKKLVDILMKSNDSAILKFAKNRANGDIRMPLRYMAEHSLYMRDNLFDDDRLFLIDNPDGFKDSRVVMIGGSAEEIFYQTRKTIMRALDTLNNQRNIQLFTDIGRLPPYYRKFMENVVGEEIKEDNVRVFLEKLDKQLAYDYLMLIIACSENQDYKIIKRRKVGFTELDYQSLQNGFENLKVFLSQF